MNKIKISLFTIFILISINTYSWEKYDKVLALVNNKPVIQSEVDRKLKLLKKKSTSLNRSRILDSLIENQIVYATAEKEAIHVTDERIVLQLKAFIKNYFSSSYRNQKKLNQVVDDISEEIVEYMSVDLGENFKSTRKLKRLIGYIEKKEKMSFREFFEQLRTRVMREQVMSIAIGASPPSKKEAKSWYSKNRSKLGFEIRSKHILIRPKSNSLSSEKKANKEISKLRSRIIAGESFEKLARKYSQDKSTSSKGGDRGWEILAKVDPFYAGNVYRMKRRGQISKVFKSRSGYHIVKFISKRAVSYDKVERMILFKLYNEKLQKQYIKWIVKEKKKFDIKIYMADYKKG